MHQAFEAAGTVFFTLGSLTMVAFWWSDHSAQKKRKQWEKERIASEAQARDSRKT